MCSRPRRSRRRQRSTIKVSEVELKDPEIRRNAFNSVLQLLIYMWTGGGLRCSVSPLPSNHFSSAATPRTPSLPRKPPPNLTPESIPDDRPKKDGFTAVHHLLKKFGRTWGLLKDSRTHLLQMAYWKKLLKVYNKIIPRVLACSLSATKIRDLMASLTHQVQTACALTFGGGRARYPAGLWSGRLGGRWPQGKMKVLLGRLAATGRGGSGLLRKLAATGRGGSELIPRWIGKMRHPQSLFTKWQSRGRTSSCSWKKGSGEDREGDGWRGRWVKGTGKSLTPRSVGPKSLMDRRMERQRAWLGSLSKKSVVAQRRNTVARRHDDVIRKYNKRMSLYKRIPLKAISRLWGWCNQIDLPTWLRVPALSLYIWMFDCNLSEAELQDLSAYNNLSAFFQRTLKPGVRPIDRTVPLTSPADGRVLFCGRVENEVLEQVKGVTYSLEEFLGCEPALASKSNNVDSVFEAESNAIEVTGERKLKNSYRHLLNDPINNELFQCIVYLAPGDYHHFHSPADWIVQHRKHFPGELFSVNPSIARWLQGLFCLNERAVYTGEWQHGFFSLTAVGATNVGSIQVRFDRSLITNMPTKYPPGFHFDADFTKLSVFRPLSSVAESSRSQVELGSFNCNKNSNVCDSTVLAGCSKSQVKERSFNNNNLIVENSAVLKDDSSNMAEIGSFENSEVKVKGSAIQAESANNMDGLFSSSHNCDSSARNQIFPYDHSSFEKEMGSLIQQSTRLVRSLSNLSEVGHCEIEGGSASQLDSITNMKTRSASQSVSPSNVVRTSSSSNHLNAGIKMSRGQQFGKFNLGSTIVLIFEAPKDFRFTVKPDERVVYGQGIGLVG